MTRFAIPIFVLTLVACGKSEKVQPPTPPVTTDAGVPAPAAATRTVGYRSPFGDAFQSDNLMVDGDFELTGRTDQAPWTVYDNGQQTLNYETGGHCRSGVRCAIIGPNDALIGYMASPATDDAEIRAYAKPDSGRCADMQIYEFDFVTNSTAGTAQPTTTSPGDDGWCFYTGKASNLAYEQPGLYIQIASNAQSKTLIVDQVSVLPASQVPVHGVMPPFVAPSAEVRARIENASTYLRTHRKYGRDTKRSAP